MKDKFLPEDKSFRDLQFIKAEEEFVDVKQMLRDVDFTDEQVEVLHKLFKAVA